MSLGDQVMCAGMFRPFKRSARPCELHQFAKPSSIRQGIIYPISRELIGRLEPNLCGIKNMYLNNLVIKMLSERSCDLFPLIVWMWVKRYSISYICELLELSPRTVAGHLRYIRTRLADAWPEYEGQLTGVVHVEAWAYTPRLKLAPPKRSYSPKRPLLLGMLSAEGCLRIFEITTKSQEEIHPLIKAHIAGGAMLITNKSKVFTGLRRDGFPALIQRPTNKTIRHWEPQGKEPNIYSFWDCVRTEIGAARGVRASNYFSRVREAELRWAFREKSEIHLYRHLIALLAS